MGLATCFAEDLNGELTGYNKFSAYDGAELEFVGDGSCLSIGSCYVEIDMNGSNGPNQMDADIITIPLTVNRSGYLQAEIPNLN